MKSIDETPVDQEGNFCDSKLALCDPKELYEKLTDDSSGIVGRKRTYFKRTYTKVII